MPSPRFTVSSRRLAVLALAPLVLAVSAPPTGATEPEIQALVDQVSPVRLAQFIQRLQDFRTRHSRTDSVIAAANWIIAQQQSFGYTNIFEHAFLVDIGGDFYPQRNIVTIKTGTTRPEEVYVIGGHYDSTSNQPTTNAPGADDDGSGTAAVLAIAEILADVDLDATVMFATWAAEEQGFVGSTAWVNYALGEGIDIQLYMNLDACAYQGDPDNVVKLFSNAQSMSFNTTMRDLCLKYTDLVPIIVNPIAFSDHVPFQNAGFPFTYSIEEDITPFIHTPNDLLNTLDMSYCQKIVQINLASLVTFSGLTTVGVTEPSLVLDAAPALRLAGMNPMRGPAILELELPAAGPAQVAVYDVEGHCVASLHDGVAGPGALRLVWNRSDGRGIRVPAGVYLARLAAGAHVEAVKLVLMP
jgi:hypothetical protein